MASKIIQVDWKKLSRVTFQVKKSYLVTYRIDVYLTKRLKEYSRTLIQRLIKEKFIKVNGRQTKPSYELNQGDVIEVELPQLIKPQTVSEDIPLDVIYEDEDMIAINKPVGMVVHPAAGHWSGTLVNALLHHCGSLPPVPPAPALSKTKRASQGKPPSESENLNIHTYRPGIVHRLDKNTSGVILAAKTSRAFLSLGNQFAQRQIHKEYLAVVHGRVKFDSDTIDKPLGRHRTDREKMAVQKKTEGREAISTYKVKYRFEKFSVVRVFPKTGRTHQIRVHLASIKHPIAGDVTYGGKKEIFRSDITGLPVPRTPAGRQAGQTGQAEDDQNAVPLLNRPALHAAQITLTHPVTGQSLSLKAELASDIKNLIKVLKQHE
ncbi:MAG: RluA family pseudouridine synthase [Planctomycetes bacterium]|nr:RluA family pseudouridine synthase [Planctomycetota bacterium]